MFLHHFTALQLQPFPKPLKEQVTKTYTLLKSKHPALLMTFSQCWPSVSVTDRLGTWSPRSANVAGRKRQQHQCSEQRRRWWRPEGRRNRQGRRLGREFWETAEGRIGPSCVHCKIVKLSGKHNYVLKINDIYKTFI